jgi:hypothetical protein
MDFGEGRQLTDRRISGVGLSQKKNSARETTYRRRHFAIQRFVRHCSHLLC